MIANMITAGIAAMAALTMNTTIETIGILTSTIVNRFPCCSPTGVAVISTTDTFAIETISSLRVQHLKLQGLRPADRSRSAANIRMIDSNDVSQFD